MHDNVKKAAQFGCFLAIPLKYDAATPVQARLEEAFEYQPLTTMDINENIKAMLDRTGRAAIGARYAVPPAALTAPLCGAQAEAPTFRVTDETGSYDFTLRTSYLYLFETQVAFLCLGLSFAQMEALQAICNPGSAYNAAGFCWVDGSREPHPFPVEDWLRDFCAPLGLQKFFDGPSSFLLDAYAYIYALMPELFDTLEEIQKITFNLHKMMSPDAPQEDLSEGDIRYVYAVKHHVYNAYRWGCCVSSQTTSYVTADAEMDFAAEERAQAEDGLPVVLLALYEKYTCLRFTELITQLDKGRSKPLRALKNMMLEFQAFGTVTPANLSRWHNVKQIYAYLLEVCDIPTAISDISSKVNILAEHQQENERARSETILNIITVFGIVSILASVLSIVQILSGGDRLLWLSTILTTAVMTIVPIAAIRTRRK